MALLAVCPHNAGIHDDTMDRDGLGKTRPKREDKQHGKDQQDGQANQAGGH